MNGRPPRLVGTRRPALALVLALALAPLAGCGALAKVGAFVSGAPQPVKPDWNSLTLAAGPDANSNSALAVDVVLIKDKALLDSLAAMSAAKYFAAKADLQRTFPEAVTVLAVEITPGQVIRLERQRYANERAWAALAFADYANPGEHRARLLLNNAGYVLRLDAQGFVASDVSR